MFGIKNKKGFSLIEIMVAIALMGIMATIIIPNFIGSRPGQERKHFIGQLNALLNYARQNAIITNAVHQVNFDFGKKTVSLLYNTGKRDEKGDQFKKVPSKYISSSIEIPDAIEVKNFFIEGYDEMSRFSGRKTGTTFFYIVPDGLAQEVVINFVDTQDKLYNGKPRQIGLVLNPFNAQLRAYDTFQKP